MSKFQSLTGHGAVKIDEVISGIRELMDEVDRLRASIGIHRRAAKKIRNLALEEAAREADGCDGLEGGAFYAAEGIRALKT